MIDDITNLTDKEIYYQFHQSKMDSFLEQLVKIPSLIIGFVSTYLILSLMHGNQALTYLLRGLSIFHYIQTLEAGINEIFNGFSLQNLIDILIVENIADIIIVIYFIVIYVALLNARKQIKYEDEDSKKFKIYLIKSFKEGSLVFPLLIMIVFPNLLQIIIPGFIAIIILVELILPFALLGELLSVSVSSVKKNIYAITHYKFNNIGERASILSSIYSKLSKIIITIIEMLIFPLTVAFIISTNLLNFLSLIYYHFLWDNPNSEIANSIWPIIIEIGNSYSNSIINESSVIYLYTFTILVITSLIYLVIRNVFKNLVNYVIDNYLLGFNKQLT